MKNTFGNQITLTLFGESHGEAIGVVLDGLAPGIDVDFDEIKRLLSLRRPSGKISTARCETDEFSIVSGVFGGKTTGTPLCIIIPNTDTRSRDYSDIIGKARPAHADYTASVKYNGFEDYRGGGHFSGRITAALVAAGGILIPALKKKGIYIGTHMKSCAGVPDREFGDILSDIKALSDMAFPVLCEDAAEEMRARIEDAAKDGDSVGGILETAVVGLPAGVGEPWFDTLEGVLSHAIFSVPAVKGVEFGGGFSLSDMRGSESNDPYRIVDGKIVTETNNQGGIGGGISNGMPLIIRSAVKPTPSIYKEQKTVDFINKENIDFTIKGRHDPCICHRARIVIDSVCALAISDMLATKYGTDYLA